LCFARYRLQPSAEASSPARKTVGCFKACASYHTLELVKPNRGARFNAYDVQLPAGKTTAEADDWRPDTTIRKYQTRSRANDQPGQSVSGENLESHGSCGLGVASDNKVRRPTNAESAPHPEINAFVDLKRAVDGQLAQL
jgi:hypothetical protein